MRYHSHCRFGGGDDEDVAFHPALIAIYRDIHTDKVMAISRRPLTLEGQSLSRSVSLGPTTGCAVKLTADADLGNTLSISESVTSALGAAMLGMSPIWAVAAASGLGNFPVLPDIKALGIIADNDANHTGQIAANSCFARWKGAGREVTIYLPDEIGTDMADVAASKAARHG